MGKLLSACTCITQWIDFAPSFKHTTFPYHSSSSCGREICVMKSRVSLSLLFYAWVCQILFTLPFCPPGPFLFCLREIFASLFYLLTLYNIVFTFFCLVYDLLFVLTKPNWTFLLYYSCFFLFCHQVRRLLLLSCFLFLSVAHHMHCWRHDLFACVRVNWWARLLWWERACLRVCVSEVAKIVVCFYFACSGKRD